MDNKRCYIVAEIGVNANAKIDIAQKLIDIAVDTGAGAVKFQAWDKDIFSHLEWLRFSFKQLSLLKTYAEIKGLQWFCTPFDFEAIDFLSSIGMKTWKIPSGKVIETEYLEMIAKKKPEWVIMSLGKGYQAEPPSIPEIKRALNIFSDVPRKTLMYCISKYPTPIEELDLMQIKQIPQLLGNDFDMGFSDHSLNYREVPLRAIKLGAKVIEKHLTLSRDMEGPDHKASLEPHEFKEMIKNIRGK